MALPRLNDIPQYELVIPSSGETVNYRPFLVKEQKVLLIAYESKDQRQIINAIMNCIASCLQEDIDVSKLSTFDADYIFTKIRSKSVGEKITVTAKCEECEHRSDAEIDLEKIQLLGDTKPSNIKITNEIDLKMKYPSYRDFISNEKLMAEEMSTASVFEMLTSCIESVMTEEENISLKDEPKEEIERFINSLTGEQFATVRGFVESMPKIILDFEFTCEACNKVNQHRLEGLQDFFS
jgi:hypothetical protein